MTPLWEAPLELGLPAEVAAIVTQWPAGAYADQAAAFRDYWLGEGGPRAVKADWTRSWYSWIRRAGTKVRAPASSPARASAETGRRADLPPVRERGEEGEREAQMRAALVVEFGAAGWLQRCGLRSDRLDDVGKIIGLTVFGVPSHRNLIDSLQSRIRTAVSRGTGLDIRWVAAIEGHLIRPLYGAAVT